MYNVYLFGKMSPSNIHGKIMTEAPKKLMPHNIVTGIQVVEIIKLFFMAMMYTPNKNVNKVLIKNVKLVKNLFPR